jgi:hypothetical protein
MFQSNEKSKKRRRRRREGKIEVDQSIYGASSADSSGNEA